MSGRHWAARLALAMASVLAVAGPWLAGADARAATASPPATAASAAPPEIPRGKGLPVVVNTAVQFVSVDGFDDNKGTFDATVDVRLVWHDTRLRYPAAQGLRGLKEYRGAAAEAELARMWAPNIAFANRVGEPSKSERRLRVHPDGRVESLVRTSATYKTPIDVSRFPFDHQALTIELAVREEPVESVDMDFSGDDVDFSRVAAGAELDGWTLGLVSLRRGTDPFWGGERHARVTASLNVQRVAGGTVATVFIPLFASLLIPFLATWMNKVEDGGFAVEAFELANVVIGGLFAVIALSFAISSSYPAIASGDNTVTRLIGLNYVALAVGLFIIVVFYRYSLPRRWLGPHVQEQAFRFLIWAFPLLSICTGVAFVLLAAA